MTQCEDTSPSMSDKYRDGVNRNARLVVRNISFKATEESLMQHFSEFGTVEEVKLLKKPDGKLVGCGFVHYTHVPMANKALLATNKKPFLGRPIYVAWAVAKHKYKEHSEIHKPNYDNSAKNNVIEIKEEDSTEIGANKPSKIRINRNARLVVRNVSFKATEDSLKQHFEPYGDIMEVKLLKKPDGKLVGCAFIHFKNVPMAKKALLNTNMKPFLGRPISVDWAVAKDKYMQHIVNQQLEMQDIIKQEDLDSDDGDSQPLNISNNDLKQEVKSESEDDNDHDEKIIKSDDSSTSDESGEESDAEEDDEDGVDDDDEDNQSQTSIQAEKKRTRLNDAEDGCTIFLTNVAFSVDDDVLRQFMERHAPVAYALVCVDRLTEHSKGSAFVKFTNKVDTDRFLALPPDQLKLEGQVMQVKPALKRENLQQGTKKQPKDNRNLYLVKEGVIVAGTKAAAGVSASDMAKRLALERSKTQMLKNLNRFVSRYRLVVSNLPANVDDTRLKKICAGVAPSAEITWCRVMRDLRAPLTANGLYPSKGYGFVMFTRHEDALVCLRKLNNNPDIFDKNNRPIVSFSIEDRTALNARKKRLEKSIANNPLSKKNNNVGNEGYKSRKRKSQAPPDESYMKKRKTVRNEKNSKPNEIGKFVRRPLDDDMTDYSGLTAKEGTQHKLRSNHKLRVQADIHRQTVKIEKKKSQRAMRLRKAAKERIKQPKQKVNKNPGKNKRRKFKPNNIKDILK
ncbi:hypothetical protein ACJJTC_013112 [Scirpophaga incertulas]